MTVAARHLTASGIASAILGKPRAKQSVHVVVKCFHEGRLERCVVLVVPYGAETGEYYTIYSERTLEALHAGATPEYLELEPATLDDDDGAV